MNSYNENLYELVLSYLTDNNITDFSKFSLSNEGYENGDSIISKWGYKIEKPTKESLFDTVKLDKIENRKIKQKDRLNTLELNKIDNPDLEQNDCMFVYKGKLCVIINGVLKKIMFEVV